jgi:hypothetical protein
VPLEEHMSIGPGPEQVRQARNYQLSPVGTSERYYDNWRDSRGCNSPFSREGVFCSPLLSLPAVARDELVCRTISLLQRPSCVTREGMAVHWRCEVQYLHGRQKVKR